MKAHKFRLYWLRESTSDLGTRIGAEDLPPSIRDRVLQLAGEDPGEMAVRLPYFDNRDMRRHDILLSATQFERTGQLIRAVVSAPAATRDMLATLAMADPLWRSTPGERGGQYFPTWSRVSQALQHWLRDRIPRDYFADLSVLADRRRAFPMIVYQACRVFPPRSRTEFTYDLGYPWSMEALAASWVKIGTGIQRVLMGLHQRLVESGNKALACRYSPLLYNDLLLAVQRRPRSYASLLARESSMIDCIIDLGSRRDAHTIQRASRTINVALQNLHSRDMRYLGPDILEEARRALAAYFAERGQNLSDIRVPHDADVSAARRPDLWIAA